MLDISFEKYCVVIASHNPPIDMLTNTISYLVNTKVKVYLVDSTPEDNSNNIPLQAKIEQYKGGRFFELIKIKENLGEGYNYNKGLEKCISDGFKLITLFSDDVIIEENYFKPVNIINFFNTKCLYDKDILSLYNSGRDSTIVKTTGSVVDSGITASSDLFKKIMFRTEFLMDQQDVYFCYQVRQYGGTIYIYPYPAISVLPVGRESNGQVHYLSIWRIYLLSRNTLTLFLETHKSEFLFSWLKYTGGYTIRFLLYGTNPTSAVRSVLYSIEDAIHGNLGITEHLAFLSNGRFRTEFKNY